MAGVLEAAVSKVAANDADPVSVDEDGDREEQQEVTEGTKLQHMEEVHTEELDSREAAAGQAEVEYEEFAVDQVGDLGIQEDNGEVREIVQPQVEGVLAGGNATEEEILREVNETVALKNLGLKFQVESFYFDCRKALLLLDRSHRH